MNIKNQKSNPEWKNIPCSKQENCFHCKCKKQDESIPKENFIVKNFDKDGNLIGDHEVTEIEIVYGNKDEVLGWVFGDQ